MYCMIELAFGNMEEVNKAVNELLIKKLICGAQVIESDSKWRWQGQIEMCKEYLVFVKTKKELADEIYEVVRQIHSYECFEFAIFDLNSSNKEYLNWIGESTK